MLVKYGLVNLQEINDEFKSLKIPPYQRPYCWSEESVNNLFNDTYEAYKNGDEEYRLGTLILFNDGDEYHIVDGQQRLTTLAILFFCLDKNYGFNLLRTTYTKLSRRNIGRTYAILRGRSNELRTEEASNDEETRVKGYQNYLLNHCRLVKIITNDEQEAFQFFDSQNSRGMALFPHDLLKSYHLREMRDMNVDRKVEIIEQWEQIDPDKLAKFFAGYLYPLTQWYRRDSGLGYSTKKIGVFKGFTLKDTCNSAVYHKASNLFIEQFNRNGTLLNGGEPLNGELNQFLLTQPIIDGIRFFNFTFHYRDLLERVRNRIKAFHSVGEIPNKGPGDRYVRRLYDCTLVFIADKFGFDSLTDKVMQLIYSWCYSLRIKVEAVYPETIDKYARGDHEEKTDVGIPMFERLNEAKSIKKEINLIVNYANVPLPANDQELDAWVLKRYRDVVIRLRKRDEY